MMAKHSTDDASNQMKAELDFSISSNLKSLFDKTPQATHNGHFHEKLCKIEMSNEYIGKIKARYN